MKKERGVFIKVFAYTMFLLVLMGLVAVFLFARQFLSFYRAEQERQLSDVFQPIINVIADKNPDEIVETALRFANSNQSYKFNILRNDGNVLFSTPGAANIENNLDQGMRIRYISMSRVQEIGTEGSYIFTGWYGSNSGSIDYGDLIRRSFLAIVLMLVIAVLGAGFFALRITKPLEDEIRRERAMEENQRLFFSAASHELKTPIASARALVEGMIAGVGDYKDHSKYLRECLKTFDSQGRLVSEILEIVKLSDKETQIEPLLINLAELGNAVLAEYRPLAEQKNIGIEGEFKDVNIRSDQNLLHRVLSNIIANAVQNTKEGGCIRIGTEERDGSFIRLHILNTGAQIPEELLPKLFDPFYRIDTARTKNNTQTGLGLAIVKKALDRMKFSFALENTPEGVVFRVDMPL